MACTLRAPSPAAAGLRCAHWRLDILFAGRSHGYAVSVAGKEVPHRGGACRQPVSAARRRDSGHFVSDTGTGRGSSAEPRSGCTVDRSVGRPPRSRPGDVGGRPLGGQRGGPVLVALGRVIPQPAAGGDIVLVDWRLVSFSSFLLIYRTALLFTAVALRSINRRQRIGLPLAIFSISPCSAYSFNFRPLLHQFWRRDSLPPVAPPLASLFFLSDDSSE